MSSISSILDSLINDFPDFTFRQSSEFRWSPHEKTIFYNPQEDAGLLLHELGHAILGHVDYKRDVELITLERDAWSFAVQGLSPRYSISISEDDVQESLDTYRDWLHARSLCPQCASTGIQVARESYKCIACYALWRVNEARACALRRHLIQNTP